MTEGLNYDHLFSDLLLAEEIDAYTFIPLISSISAGISGLHFSWKTMVHGLIHGEAMETSPLMDYSDAL